MVSCKKTYHFQKFQVQLPPVLVTRLFRKRYLSLLYLSLPLVFSLLLFLGIPVPSTAWAARPTVRLSEGGRANLRGSSQISSETVVRLELELLKKISWVLFPFLEVRRDVDRSAWSRIELGLEWGLKPFPGFVKPLSWFYLGHGIHQAWVKPGNDRFEWEIRGLFDIPLPWKIRTRPMGFYLLNEYTYDVESGAGIRNEVGAGFKIPLPIPRFHAFLGWRHVDRVHEADIDQFEGSLLAEF